MKNKYLYLLLFMHFLAVSEAQINKSEILSMISSAESSLDKSDELADKSWKLAKKSLLEKDINEAVLMATDAMKLAEESKKFADLAEKTTDEIEQKLEASGCTTAAQEADEAEDYCRHTGYYTYEMFIYAKKAINEKDESYFKSYINKVINYAEDAYESVKNAKSELEQTMKDMELCIDQPNKKTK